ncbi:MAG: GNAT family N-acetyltransferase [Candidatus Schekmanbacteria bacterium]|nr:GNAT family N-acetyltransferase [Candidatus Schekmanbacteria bacterium]
MSAIVLEIATERLAPRRGRLAVEVVQSSAGLAALAPEWSALTRRSPGDHPFNTHAWVSCWWDSFGSGHALRVFVFRDGTELVAVAPMMLSVRRVYGLRTVTLEFLANAHTSRFDLAGERSDRVYLALWQQVTEMFDELDYVTLCQLPADSPTLRRLPALARADAVAGELWHAADAPYLELEGTFDGYLRSLSAKHRANLRNRLGRLMRSASLDMEIVTSGSEVESALAEGIQIEGAAWKQDAGTAIASTESCRQFYAQLVPEAARHGWLRLCFLTAGGRRIAFAFALEYGGRFFLVKTGFDPLYRQYSPTNLLVFHVLKHCYERGLSELDFLGDDEPWKREWTATTRRHEWLFLFPHGWRSRAVRQLKFHILPRLRASRLYRPMSEARALLNHAMRRTQA